MLSQLIYVSLRTAECAEADVDKILASATKNNAKIDVTGVLLYSEQKFLQCLEGEYTEIMALYDHIKLDKRHKNAVMISVSKIEERVFPSWQMGAKKFNLKDIELRGEMPKEEKEDFEKILAGENPKGTKAINLMKRLISF